mmetsp:Transcript_28505/g.71185  ORF Transcript_28505/g.71185 Transcript_28505/m.71185 type:complete len:146 (-) Transcript_28505:215-652(-)
MGGRRNQTREGVDGDGRCVQSFVGPRGIGLIHSFCTTMDGNATQMSEMATRDQMLKQIQAYQTNQTRVNNGIGRLTQMDTAAITPLVVAKVSRQLANGWRTTSTQPSHSQHTPALIRTSGWRSKRHSTGASRRTRRRPILRRACE